jgi:hypothetical protein
MNILLVYPKCPDTYWSFKHALRFISKKASIVPLGLITVASILPGDWKKRLTDLKCLQNLRCRFPLGRLCFHKCHVGSACFGKEVIERCLLLNAKIVGGGPYSQRNYEQFPGVDHLVLNEAEILYLSFLRISGTELRRGSIYR